jgi:hypothetical protein
MKRVITWLMNFFFKKQAAAKKDIVDLSRWEFLNYLPENSYTNDTIVSTNLKDLSVALRHATPEVQARFIRCTKNIIGPKGAAELQKLIVDSKASKEQSDKMKAHIGNNCTHFEDPNYSHLPFGSFDSRNRRRRP